MESVNYMQAVPHSAFTIGDIIEVEVEGTAGNWITKKGRITNDWENHWLFSVIEESEDELGNPIKSSNISYYMDDKKSFNYRNPKIIEQGPWHYLLCGDM